jgi:hypothetical protein
MRTAKMSSLRFMIQPLFSKIASAYAALPAIGFLATRGSLIDFGFLNLRGSLIASGFLADCD